MTRKTYFKENVFRGNDSNTGQWQLSTWTCPSAAAAREAGLAGEASPSPSSGSLRPGLHHHRLFAEQKMQGVRRFKRGRFLSLQGYRLVICYMLPAPLFPRLVEEQKQLLIKIQNYKARLAERKQYLSHICFWEGYNSHKSWAKLYFLFYHFN